MTTTFIHNAQLLMPDGQFNHGGLLIENGCIAKLVEQAQSSSYMSAISPSTEIIDAQQRLLTPGLVDCHTHLVFAGDRSHELAMRLEGMSYEQIATQGGGIHSTVEMTRKATKEQLISTAKQRILHMLRHGVTTVEIKSGYGLSLASELLMLEVIQSLQAQLPVSIEATCLSAHTTPKEFMGNSNEYIDELCNHWLPLIKSRGLASSVDVFCERIGFDLSQTEKVFSAAQSLGLNIKCHAEQLSLMGGAELASRFGALSCDHLEYLDEAGVIGMQANDVVAVLLPGAFYYLQETQKPPVELFRKHQVPMAIATDFNPGSSPTMSLSLMMNMSCILFGLTVAEAWLAVTYHAAKALGLKSYGLQVGAQADCLLWPLNHSSQLIYELGRNYKPDIFLKGRPFTVKDLGHE